MIPPGDAHVRNINEKKTMTQTTKPPVLLQYIITLRAIPEGDWVNKKKILLLAPVTEALCDAPKYRLRGRLSR